MPIYEFECLRCGVSFESLLRKAEEISKVTCPSCEGNRLEEKVSRFAGGSKSGASSLSGASDCAPSGG